MEIWVYVKQVLDARLPLEVSPQGNVAQKEPSAVFVADPADRSALEEAMRIRREAIDCRVTAVTLGPKRAGLVLADCLARGADRVVHLLSDESWPIDSFVAARFLSREIERSRFDLILCGDRTLDDGPNEVGPFLAELLGIAQVTGVVKLTVSALEGRVRAERKLERGYRQVVEVGLPALVSVDSSICQPRYVPIRARKYAATALAKHCSVVQLQGPDLGEGGLPLRTVVRRSAPRPRPKKVWQPDSALTAGERMALLMGGVSRNNSGKAITGKPEQAADEIITFLRDRGVLP